MTCYNEYAKQNLNKDIREFSAFFYADFFRIYFLEAVNTFTTESPIGFSPKGKSIEKIILK